MNTKTPRIFLLVTPFLALAAGVARAETPALPPGTPAGYLGLPFDDKAYREEQRQEEDTPRQPYHGYSPAVVAWDSKAPTGSGWVGADQPSSSLQLDAPDAEGRRFIHCHVSLPNYRYAAFGWNWAGASDAPVDMDAFDAVSFSIKVTGPQRPQEMFLSTTETQPSPLSLRDYDPDFTDGSWHRITIPLRSMRWSPGVAHKARGFTLTTFVWEPCESDILVDHVTFDRAQPGTSLPAETKPMGDAAREGQHIPGKIECAFYDLGGEGVAYHDTTPMNALSGVLNQQRKHQRSHATPYYWNFRREEGVDISFVKDWADLNHPNLVVPPVNQLYIGCTEDGEWCNYTVTVAKAGAYDVTALYGSVPKAGPVSFSVDGVPACECIFPVMTGSMHSWNKARVGRIRFEKPGTHVLTLHYSKGYNLGYFEFAEAD